MMKALFTALLVCVLLFSAENTQTQVFRFEEPVKVDPAQEQYELGMQALAAGGYKSADRYFTRFLELNGKLEPGYARGVLMRSRACLKDGRPQDALAAVNAHASGASGLKDPVLKSELKFVSAQAFGMMRDWDSVRKITGELLKEGSPSSIARDIRLLNADAARYQRDWKGVISVLNGEVSSEKNAFPEVMRLARAYVETGEYSRSLQLVNSCKVVEGSAEAMMLGLLKVRNLVKSGDGKAAGEIFEKLKSAMPSEPDADWWNAVVSIASASVEDGRYAEADVLYASAMKLAPDTDRLRFTLSKNIEMNLKAGFIEKARGNLEIMAKKFPESRERLDLTGQLGMLLYNKGNFNEAASYFRQLVEYRHANAALRYISGINLGECLYLSGQRMQAVEAFLGAESSASDADEHAYALLRAGETCTVLFRESVETKDKKAAGERAIKIFSDIHTSYSASKHAPAALLRKAGLLVESEKYAAAAETYAAYAVFKGVAPADAATARLKQGECLRRGASDVNGKLAAAGFFEKLAAAGGQIVDEACLGAALCAREGGDIKRAEASLEKVIANRNSSKRAEALFLRACMRFDFGMIREARQDVDIFLAQYPSRMVECNRVAMLAGDSCANVGDWVAALKYYAIPANPERNSELRSEALYESAVAEYRQKSYDAALAHISTLLGLPASENRNGLLARAYYLKGDVLTSRMDYEGARDAYARCVTEAGNTMLGYAALGRQGETLMVLASMQKTDEGAKSAGLKAAEDCFVRIIKDKSGSPYAPVVQMAEYNLAVCLARQGNQAAALEQYENIYFAYRNNYVDHSDQKRTPRPLDDFYMTNSLIDMIAILEKKGDSDSLDKVRRYRSFLEERRNIPLPDEMKQHKGMQ